MTEHHFGGNWTEIKLEIVKKYLHFYTTALTSLNLPLIYIDAFAGTGSREQISKAMPMLGKEKELVKLAGSARNALETNPPFDKYIFIEKQKKRCQELEKLKNEFESLNIAVINDDSNSVLAEIIEKPLWKGNNYRGVIFLDPYGLQVNWTTLQAICATKSFDLWFLFPISGVCRQAAKNYEKMDKYKRECLDKIFGTNEWFEEFYNKKSNKPVQLSMFPGDGKSLEEIRRDANIKQIEEWVRKRLQQCFPYVSAPKALPESGSQLFSLFFCVSNDSPKAIGLAQKVANQILKST
jgi:three-Cys-motif partner protein